MIKWSASRLDAANYCLMLLWLKYYDPLKPKQENLAAFAKGGLLHNLIENFWQGLGDNEKQVKSQSKAFKKIKYYDSESFAKHAQGKWMQRVKASEFSDNPISWRFEKQEFVIKSQLKGICQEMFPILYKEGTPEFSELPIDFIFGNKRFTGRIDEVRIRNGKVIIRDFKSGKPWLGHMKINHDPQLTIYNAGLCELARKDPEIAEKLGLEDRVKYYGGNPLFVDPEINMEFFMVEAPYLIKKFENNPKKYSSVTSPQTILPTHRTNEHFFEVLNMIDGTMQRIREGIVYAERGRKCDSCSMKQPCEKKLSEQGIGNLEDYAGNICLSLVSPMYAKNQEKEIQEIKKRKRKGKSHPDQMSFRLQYKNSPHVCGN
ncbi:MAG: PD-(D/E)XK nuclease family protein [Nanoarchaeota archaeon]